MATIDSIVSTITEALDGIREPASTLPAFFLLAAGELRPGLSPYRITGEVINYNKAVGIPTENNPSGADNLINQYTYNVVKAVIEALKNDAAIHIAIPQNSLLIKSEGPSAGGPVVSIGTNLTTSVAKGIVQ
jgi:hypothetical protein